VSVGWFNAARSSCGRQTLKGGVGVKDKTLKLCVLGRKDFATWNVV
jgi:hypothetical protein